MTQPNNTGTTDLRGTPLDDSIPGTSKRDQIFGLSGNDTILGFAGDDLLKGGLGADEIFGGFGNDMLFGERGDDRIWGGLGDDRIWGGWGDDTLSGGTGHDRMWGGIGHDRLWGGAGNDHMWGGTGNDRMWGGNGHDRMLGGAGSDRMWGGNGHDRMWGDDGNDRMWGGTGRDRMWGDDGNDSLYGGSGSDTMWGGDGRDRLDGGANNDHLIGNKGNDVLLGGMGDDTLYGDDAHPNNGAGAYLSNDRLAGGAGHDYLVGGHGNDTLNGGTGDDLLFGDYAPHKSGKSDGRGQNSKDKGGYHGKLEFDDVLNGQAGDDTIFAGLGDDVVKHGVGENLGAEDTYDGGRGFDTLRLDLTYPEWLLLNENAPQLQTDFTDYLAFLSDQTNGGQIWASSEAFAFSAIGVTASAFEAFRVFVDGVEINPEDEAVTANDDTYLGLEGAIEDGPVLSGRVIDNDLFPDFFRDVRLISDIGANEGSLTLRADGSFDYDVGTAFQSLGLGDSALISFEYEARDADGDTDRATATIEITGTNDAPIAGAVFALGTEDVTLTGRVTASDVDNLQSELVFTVISGPSHGNVTMQTDGSFSYIGDGDYAGADRFIYQVADGDGGFDTAAVDISLAAVADTPELGVQILEGASVNQTRFIVTATQTDADGSEFIDSIVATGVPAGAILTPGSVNPATQPGQITQEFVLTLPMDQNSDFDLTFTATSRETSNGSQATRQVVVPVDYDYRTQSSTLQFAATDQSIWGSGDQFVFTDDRFIGFDTGAFNAQFGGPLYAGVSGDVRVGLQSSLSFEGGQINASADYNVTVESNYNRTTDELLIETDALLLNTAFNTVGPSGSYALDFVYDILFNAYAGVNVDLGGIDFGLLGEVDFGSVSARSDLATIDTGPGSLNLINLNSDDLAGEIPFPSPLDAFSINLDWPDIATSGTGTTAPATSAGESENFLELVLDLDDLAFQLATNYPVNPLNPPRAFVGPFFVEYDLLDVDVIGGLNFFQDFRMALGDLSGTLVFENGTSRAFTFGDDIELSNANLIDMGGNQNGVVDYTFFLTPDAQLTNETSLGFNLGVETSLFEVELGYNVSIDNPLSAVVGPDSFGFSGSTSFGPLAGYEASVPVGAVDVYDDTFALGFVQESLTVFA